MEILLNTLENKAKFFAQYWGQKVIRYHEINQLWKVEPLLVKECSEDDLLELKPLSEISDEDAKQLAYRLGDAIDINEMIHKSSSDLVKEIIESYSSVQCLWMLNARFTDKVRELGYAIDWNNLTVEQQISYGWVRLTNKNN